MLYAFHTLFKCKARLMLVLLVVLAFSTSSNAQSVLTDDADTKSDARNRNFGTLPNLNISPTQIAYVKFKLSSTLPADTPGSNIARATLKLYLGTVRSPGKIDVFFVTSAWDESSVTYETAPTLGSLITSTNQIQIDARGKFLSIDLTPAVAQWLGQDGHGTNGVANFGVALAAHPVDDGTPGLVDVVFDSKENSQTSHEPQLTIYLNDSNALGNVAHDPTLTGNGTSTSPLGVAAQGIGTTQLADNAVNAQKIASGQVVKNLNGLSDNVILQAGSNITITPAGNTLTIDSSGSGPSVIAHNNTLTGDGSTATPLGIATPLSLTGSNAGAILSVANTGSGVAIDSSGDVNTSTRYRIGGNAILSINGQNTFVGVGVGDINTGHNNSFFGYRAGFSNTTGFQNTFSGVAAGGNNSTGANNAFFGFNAGVANTTGIGNAFFGSGAGRQNTEGNNNSFFGLLSGVRNTTGIENSFFGTSAGFLNSSGAGNSGFGIFSGGNNTTGVNNTFLGNRAGTTNTTENNNTFVGAFANGTGGITNGTAIGFGASVTQSNSLVLGNYVNVGVGVSAPSFKLHVLDTANTGLRVQTNTQGGTVASFGGNGDFQVDANGVEGGRLLIKENGNVGIGTASPSEKLTVAGTIQSTSGGFKFPDGTVQTSAAQSPAGADTYTSYGTYPNYVYIPPKNSAPVTILTTTVPPGNYLIFATAEFKNHTDFFGQDNRRTTRCTMLDEDWLFTLNGGPHEGFDDNTEWNIHSVKIFNQPTTITVSCRLVSGGTDRSDVWVTTRRISAVKIGNITVQ